MTLLLRAIVLAATLGQAQSKDLDRRVEEVLQVPEYKNAHWGVLVADAKTGKTVFEKNADRLFAPASVAKLYSTAAALIDLGADHRFRTPIVRKGEVKDGTLQGDLILVAKGDLCLGGRTGPDGALLFEDDDHTYSGGNSRSKIVAADPLAGLDHLAREVREAGIKAVSGDVLVDDRLFEPATGTGSGPSRLTPILVNDNLIDVVVTPAETVGSPASTKLVPQTGFASFDVQVETVAEGTKTSVVVRAIGPRRYTVRGKVPIGHAPFVKVAEVEEPAAFARTLLIEALRRRGVTVAASPLGDNDRDDLPSREGVADLPKVAEYTSPPLAEYTKVILKVSHNLHASTLPLLVAARHNERTLVEGMRRQGAALKGLGVEVGTISFGGGAGGDRADLTTPRATVSLLRAMAKRPEAVVYEVALPVLGRDGTLARHVAPDSPARGHVRAKTGTYTLVDSMSGQGVLTSKALAGYMETASGRPLVLAVFLNGVRLNVPAEETGEASTAAGRHLGKLCEVLYEAVGNDPDRGQAVGR